MAEKKCPKCNRQSRRPDRCDFCGTIFAKVSKVSKGSIVPKEKPSVSKQDSIGLIYTLIRAGDLLTAKELTAELALQFPENKSDFIILQSNINRDISIVERLQQAVDAFSRQEYTTTVQLLRNIKAFDHGLDERVISLRVKAEQQCNNDSHFKQAVDRYKRGRLGEAAALFSGIKGHKEEDAVNSYLGAIKKVKNNLLGKAIEALSEERFHAANQTLNELLKIFPDLKADVDGYLSIIRQKRQLRDVLLAAARKAQEEKRFLEAKAMYGFLKWQCPDLRVEVQHTMEEIGSRVSLADCNDAIDFAALGVQVDSDGFINSVFMDGDAKEGLHSVGHPLTHITPVKLSFESVPDSTSDHINLDEDQVEDFS